MRKIIVTVPRSEGGKWKVSIFGSRGKTRASASTAFQLVERGLNDKKNLNSEARLKEKTCVKVKHGDGFINESLNSDQPRYLLYCLACFLEDFLSESVLSSRYKKYGKYSGDY